MRLLGHHRRIECVARLTLIIVAILALQGFSTSVPARANSNPVHLELGGDGASSWNIENICPGDSGAKTITLRNSGRVNGLVTIWLSELTTKGELYEHLLLKISCNPASRLKHNLSLPTTIDKLPQDASRSSGYLVINPLNVGETVTLVWQWELPAETGNEAENNSISFTISYRLEQLPTSPGGGMWDEPDITDRLPGITDVRSIINSDGVFTEPITIASFDSLCHLGIDEGTIGLTSEGKPLSEIGILQMPEPLPVPEATYIIGLIYDFQPDGATFDPPATLEYSYDSGALPEGVAEEDLVIAYYDEEVGEWVELDSTVDTEAKTITAKVSHFTTFVIIGAVTPPPEVVPPEEEEVVPPEEEEVVPPEEEEVAPEVVGVLLPINWPLIGGIIAGVVALGLIIFFLVRRRAQLTMR